MTASTSRADALTRCPECRGRGAYDDPPWGIVSCECCSGKGTLRIAAPVPSDERVTKLYNGRTAADLREICSTRPAHYPKAHHEFDKTILDLLDEIEQLKGKK